MHRQADPNEVCVGGVECKKDQETAMVAEHREPFVLSAESRYRDWFPIVPRYKKQPGKHISIILQQSGPP